MSREIKFRLWNNCGQHSKMFYKTDQVIECLKQQIEFNNSEPFSLEYGYDHEGDGSYFMQFTGLKDKNGIEIFNADIFSDKWKAEVYQNDEGTFMVRFRNNPKVNKPRSLKKYLMDRDIAGTSDRDCIIIGNIYQNPELLETVQK